MQKDFWRELFRPENKKTRSNIFMILFVGILLLVLGKTMLPQEQAEPIGEQNEVVAAKPADGRELEQRMAEILSKIEGAGEVDVMLTFRTGEEKIIAKEEKTEESSTQGEESIRREEAVVLTEDSRGNTAPVILMENTAQVEGVVIVAQGGDNAVVCNALNAAAQALLNVPAHKIAVLKMK